MLIEVPQSSLTIQTRVGNPIPNLPGITTIPQDLIQQIQYTEGKYPQGNLCYKRKEATSFYNCHALTFLSRRAWMVEDAVNMVLQDDEYFPVDSREVLPGDIILYYSNGQINHSGIVVSRREENELVSRPWIVSKWAHAGEYVHRYDYCPYDSSNVRYMREGQHD